jgi:uncharacterized RDD family membrane protein YckC
MSDAISVPGTLDATPIGREVARTRRRVAAYAIDAVVVAVIVFAVAAAAVVALGPAVRFSTEDALTTLTIDTGRAMVNALLGLLVAAVYFVLSWTRFGRTPGQRLLGIRVERAADGGRLTPIASVVRWLALVGATGLVAGLLQPVAGAGTWLAPLIVGWSLVLLLTTIVSRNGRGLHDGLAGSVVVRDASGRRA